MPARCLVTLLPASCLLLFLLFLLTMPFREVSAAPRCREYDRPAPTNCKYGTSKDWCKNGVCAKGPGEPCGGYQRRDGDCGEGMRCVCGRCRGCSPVDRKCFQPVPINCY
ncbi:neuroparsin-A-like [Eriocheir sinensis]|uniref:neuroparsin-A-like n=1 Tax=Eriocheir sinensis TaxID=95602 RepID=UPI0021C5D8B9|nr:neuroparsin-A-like [Eriocheir sinensis]